MANVRIGYSGPVFGTTNQAYGLIQSEEANTEVQESEIIGGDGDIVGVDQYGKKTTVSFEYMYAAATGPDADDVGTGSTITSPETSTAIYVRSATRSHSIAPGYRMQRIEGTEWPDLLT
jgi:hypothetical protein